MVRRELSLPLTPNCINCASCAGRLIIRETTSLRRIRAIVALLELKFAAQIHLLNSTDADAFCFVTSRKRRTISLASRQFCEALFRHIGGPPSESH